MTYRYCTACHGHGIVSGFGPEEFAEPCATCAGVGVIDIPDERSSPFQAPIADEAPDDR